MDGKWEYRVSYVDFRGRISTEGVEFIRQSGEHRTGFVRKYLDGIGQTKPTAKIKPAHIIDLEDKLSTQLGTRVTIETRKNGQRGKIIIEFYSLDEFDNITERIGLACEDVLEKK